jgi:transcriptional regulator with PAS, ATPase and Fis domain
MMDEMKKKKDPTLDKPWMIKELPPSDREDAQWNAHILTNEVLPIASTFQLVPLELAKRIVSDHNKSVIEGELTLAEWERIQILKRMKKYEKSTSEVAKSMGLSIRTVQYKLIKYK